MSVGAQADAASRALSSATIGIALRVPRRRRASGDEGLLQYREDIVEGIDSAPAAFIGLLQGRNFGKLLVRLSPDLTR